MNSSQKSESMKARFRKDLQVGNSKMAKRKCYGYKTAPDGTLTIIPEEAEVVIWIFEQYRSGKSMGKIAAGLEEQGILSPTGKPKWNRETIDNLLSNEKYTGRVLLPKTINTDAGQIENDSRMERYLYIGFHKTIVSDELFEAVQQEKLSRSKEHESGLAMTQVF